MSKIFAKLYKITHIKDGRYYIGITYGKNPCMFRRFKKHLSGKGGVFIKHLLENGSNKEDFIIEEIEEGLLQDLYDKERELSILWPEGLNGNKGYAVRMSPESRLKAQSKKNEKWFETRVKMIMTTQRISKDAAEERIKFLDYEKDFLKNIFETEGKKYKSICSYNNKKEIQLIKEQKLKEIEEYKKSKEERMVLSKIKMSKSQIKNRANESQEKKNFRIENQKNNFAEKTKEEKNERNKKISQSKQNKKDEISKKSKEYHNSLSEEQKKARGRKISETKLRKKHERI